VRDRNASAETRRSVRSEIGADLLLLTIRAASAGCIDRRLQEIGTILASAGNGLYYNAFEFLDREQEREQVAWAQLRGLEDWQGPLAPTALFGFAMAL
jgi:hypothetical protein